MEYYSSRKVDVPINILDISKAKNMIGYEPRTTFEKGVEKFINWYKNRG